MNLAGQVKKLRKSLGLTQRRTKQEEMMRKIKNLQDLERARKQGLRSIYPDRIKMSLIFKTSVV
ncbi:unnamed protein product [marine sediment metagenome]|uniref:Uncharacterized protein n=1 Tax=marine sediment metagenome TaxID=412755 RepID=X1T4G1_9ZZZZ